MLAEMSQRLGVPLQSAASYLRYLKSVKETADALKKRKVSGTFLFQGKER
jgi:hypothetical protein